MSIDSIIDDLDALSLRALCARYLYAVSEHDRDLERLRFTVRDGYERGEVPAGAIVVHAEAARDARLDAANRIIASQNHAIAAASAEIERLGGSAQFLIVAMRRDARARS